MHRHTIRTSVAIVSALVSLAACSELPTASPALAPASHSADVLDASNTGGAMLSGDKVNLTIPTVFHAQNPCAGGRFGEIVVFTGNQHLVFFDNSTANGHLNTKIQWNADDVTGVGQYTGMAYRATGVTQDHTISDAALPYEYTMVNAYHIIGQGQATNMDLHETVHFTVNANGWVTATVTDYTLSCHGDSTF